MPEASQIFVIRHAEKPPDPEKDGHGPPPFGVDADGNEDNESLIPLGWERAGALVALFADPAPPLAKPGAIFASGPNAAKRSKRPEETVEPLAKQLNLDVQTEFGFGDEVPLVQEAKQAAETVLIAWQHEHIPLIANAIMGSPEGIPQHWKGSRFDLVWVFTRAGDAWDFQQVPQMLMPGDKDKPLRVDDDASDD